MQKKVDFTANLAGHSRKMAQKCISFEVPPRKMTIFDDFCHFPCSDGLRQTSKSTIFAVQNSLREFYTPKIGLSTSASRQRMRVSMQHCAAVPPTTQWWGRCFLSTHPTRRVGLHGRAGPCVQGLRMITIIHPHHAVVGCCISMQPPCAPRRAARTCWSHGVGLR